MNEIQTARMIRVLERMEESLSRIELYLTPLGVARTIEFWGLIEGHYENLGGNMVLKQGEKAVLKLRILDAGGNPAQVQDGKIEWSLSDPAFGDLKVSEDMMSAEFMPKGQAGKCLIQAKADADLGEGVKEIMGELMIEQLSGEAAVIELVGEALPL